MDIYICIYIHMGIHVLIYIYVSKHMYASTYVHTCKYNICICVYTYIQTLCAFRLAKVSLLGPQYGAASSDVNLWYKQFR